MLRFLFVASLVNLAAGYRNSSFQQEEIDGFVPLNGYRFDLFDWNLSTTLAKSDPGNVLLSPISAKLLLKMLYEGSTGMSADELARALNLPRDKTVSRLSSSNVLRSLQTQNLYYDMEIGSRMFITQNVSPKNWYQRILYLYYNAYIEKLDFADGNTVANRINGWVKYITRDHIPELFNSHEDFSTTVMLLVNAVYFKGSWVLPFGTSDTIQGKFVTPGGPKDVYYMTQNNYFYYARNDELHAQILRLPYLGQKFAMNIILPERPDGLDELIRMLKPEVLRKQIWLLEETSLEVFIPKFRFDYKTELKSVLKQLGIRKIFDSYNDMKGLTRNSKVRDLVVSDVIQRAAIDVNEEGSTAAVATVFQLTNKFGGNDEIFNASHPFLFFIEDESTGTIVFIGKVVEPVGYDVPKVSTAATSPFDRPAFPTPALPHRKTGNRP